eukprot:COSAG02_NODE_15038_length_1210_cov_1.781278_1_plen_397_part_10
MTYKGSKLTYEKLDKAHLVAACRKRGLDTEGTKDELVQRMEQWAAANGEPEDALIDEEEEAAIARELEQKEQAIEHLRKANAEFETMKAPALRKELAQRGLETSGKKAVLMERLARAIDAEAEALDSEHAAAAQEAKVARSVARVAAEAAAEAAQRFRPKDGWVEISWDRVDMSFPLSASKVWCKLQQGQLVWYKQRPEKGSKSKDNPPKKVIRLEELSMHVETDSFGKVEHPLKQKMLHTRSDGSRKVVTLECETETDMADWVSAIENAFAVHAYTVKARQAEKVAKRRAEEEKWNWRTAVGDGDTTDASRAEGGLIVHHNSILRGPRWLHLSMRWLVIYEEAHEMDDLKDRVKAARIPMESVIVRPGSDDAHSTITVDLIETSRLEGLKPGMIEF